MRAGYICGEGWFPRWDDPIESFGPIHDDEYASQDPSLIDFDQPNPFGLKYPIPGYTDENGWNTRLSGRPPAERFNNCWG
ncbi:MAG TPA: hypothetical protein VFQ85_18120 [Mycobacteriales bacterium]|jgi:hypothetical protein|nr:hypothetical protein [Mycobacteriales bacterium]